MKKIFYAACSVILLLSLPSTSKSSSMNYESGYESGSESEASHAPRFFAVHSFNLNPSTPESSSHLMSWAQAQKDKRRALKGPKVSKNYSDLPQKMDLLKNCPPVDDQGNLGSCTAHAISAAVRMEQKSLSLPDLPISRLFLYFNARSVGHTQQEDSGASIADAVRAITYGIPPESLYPYDDRLSGPFKNMPDPAVYEQGIKLIKSSGIQYRSVPQDEEKMMRVLANQEEPIVFGALVFDSLVSRETARTGIMKMPTLNEDPQGGHALLILGYDNRSVLEDNRTPNPLYRHFFVRNSWSAKWGQKGYFWMPFDFVLNPNYAFDFWRVSNITGVVPKFSMESSQSEKIEKRKNKIIKILDKHKI